MSESLIHASEEKAVSLLKYYWSEINKYTGIPEVYVLLKYQLYFSSVLRIRIRTDPHLKFITLLERKILSPPGSGSVWTDPNPDLGGKKA